MHEAAETVLRTGGSIYHLVGQTFNGYELTQESAKDLDRGYIQPVRALAQGGQLYVEQRLSITHITGEEDAFGTSDTVITHNKTLIIADLKWGMGAQVYAQGNKQLCTYALAALKEFEIIQDYEDVLLMICQPRLKHIDEWRLSVAELMAIGEELKVHAQKASALIDYAQKHGRDMLECLDPYVFSPSESNCRWCKAKVECKALRNQVLTSISAEFEDLEAVTPAALKHAKAEVKNHSTETLAKLMPLVDLIQAWCKAIIAKGEAEIHAGRKIPGFKLVMGKQGNRNWVDPAEVAKAMKAMRLKESQMYSKSLISPTRAEELLSDNPRRWEKLKK